MEIDRRVVIFGLIAWVGVIAAFVEYRSGNPGWYWWLGITAVCGVVYWISEVVIVINSRRQRRR